MTTLPKAKLNEAKQKYIYETESYWRRHTIVQNNSVNKNNAKNSNKYFHLFNKTRPKMKNIAAKNTSPRITKEFSRDIVIGKHKYKTRSISDATIRFSPLILIRIAIYPFYQGTDYFLAFVIIMF